MGFVSGGIVMIIIADQRDVPAAYAQSISIYR